MLKIESKPQFSTMVKVNTAAIQGDFQVVFEALPDDELQPLDDGQAGSWKKLLQRVVVSFETVQVCGESVEGYPTNLPKLIRWPGVGAAMVSAYYKGLWENTQGN